MAQAVAMGANTIRSHTLGISVGQPKSVWPTANKVNNGAWDVIDYSIAAASRQSPLIRATYRAERCLQATDFA